MDSGQPSEEELNRAIEQHREEAGNWELGEYQSEAGPRNLPNKIDTSQVPDGYIIPETLAGHRTVSGTYRANPIKAHEWAPFDPSQSKATGAIALKNKIAAGRIVASRIAGMSYPDIGKALGMHPNAARRLVAATLEQDFPVEGPEEMRQLINAQYDAMLKAYWVDAQSGDEKAAKIVTSILEAKRKLNAVDVPVTKKQEHTVAVALEEEAVAILERFGPEFIDVEVVSEEATERPPMPISSDVLELLGGDEGGG